MFIEDTYNLLIDTINFNGSAVNSISDYTYDKTYLDTKFLKYDTSNNIIIDGDLTVHGTTTIIDTNTQTTEQLIITNDGTGPAVVINQKGNQPIFEVQDDGSTCFKIFDGGNININHDLTVNGNIINTNLNNILNNKENILSFNAPLNRNGNNINIDFLLMPSVQLLTPIVVKVK